MTNSELTDRVVGCVLGGAVGDALGAPFEGLWSHSIPEPAELLADYAEFEGYPCGQFTDDTQLAVAALQSIVRRGDVEPADIARAISNLWRSQGVVGPGGACTSAADRLIAGGHWSECGAPDGQAGNGTAMRIAALGLFYWNHPGELGEMAAHVSRITHQDARSVAGGVAIAAAARLLANDPQIDAESLCRGVATEMRPFHAAFAQLVHELPDRLHGPEAEVMDYLAWSGMNEPEFAAPIITPYVIPTVLAALWAVVTHPHSWSDAVAAVIRLGGDVDTLGAIVGGLMGARWGEEAIPAHLREGVFESDRLRTLAIRYAQVIAR